VESGKLAEAARLIEVADERYYEAELHRLQGGLLYTTDDRRRLSRAFTRPSPRPRPNSLDPLTG
jgi:hypothetical protein